NDSRGFYTSRCFMTYPLEASNMLSEGISPVLIENSGVYAGMAVGPFAVNDEVGIDLSHHISEATKAALGDKYHAEASHEVIAKLYDLGRYGKKNSKGFYEYPENDKKHIWKGLADYYPLADEQPSQEDVTRRLIYRQALEVVRCLEENVVTEPEDADIGAIFGWGFAPWTGGPISMIDTIGIDKFISECDELSKKHGDVFKVPEMLRKMQKDGQRFYS
ncbi:MAG TPA: 3-hydroxyacyl-CoA dehydrogenase family protein, partial [Emcibacteraceae bacterium]|nr:3-hydroxyacyl-CoA dehydrogenase family protein [Emcibacteraceae bacterium]